MQPRRQHQITKIRKPLIVSRGWIYLQCTGWGWVRGCQKISCAVSGFGQVFYSRNEDGDSNENGKKALSLLRKTTTPHVQHTFLYIFAFTARLRRENHLISSQFVEDVNLRQRLFFSFAIKFEAACLQFLSDVFVAVAVVVAYSPLCPARKASRPKRDCG